MDDVTIRRIRNGRGDVAVDVRDLLSALRTVVYPDCAGGNIDCGLNSGRNLAECFADGSRNVAWQDADGLVAVPRLTGV